MRLPFPVIFLIATSLTACAGYTAPDGVPAIASGNQSDMTTESIREVDDYVELAQMWDAAFSHQPAPPHFSMSMPQPRQRFLAVFMGRQSHGGFSIQVIRAGEVADAIEVELLFVSPGPGCPTTQAFTSPYAVFEFPAGPKPLRYTVRRQIKSC